ncbi:MAG: winged helix-turn-helix domain-containing protein, partial [Candidatus Caenarcaniphilales bacterium]|nr:winged helix-turn-helix domain-containing protein [Candidatus Caenarcaniphilales bacterium]
MAIPNYEAMMLPLLNALQDGNEHNFNDVVDNIAQSLNLSDAEKEEKISSGQNTLKNRIGWARTYLKKAGLVKDPKR